MLALLPGGGAWTPSELPLGIDTPASSDSSSRPRRARSRRPWVATSLPPADAKVPGSLEARVLAVLEDRPQTPDEITLRAGTSFRETSSVLLRFEMEGLVRREFGGRVRLQPKLRFSPTERS